ncbi:PIG-L deacetylase family protein, partial [Rhodococcus sp. CSLK01-03]
MNTTSTTLPENWNRAMAIVAHPDDLEYGAAGAVARWTRSGKAVAYVVATDGEAGIDGRTPAEAAPLRRREQLDAAAVVGVEDVTFLEYRDGVVEYGLDLRRAVAREIRRFRPDVLITATYEPTYGLDGGRIVNQADHRAVGLAVLDAARDAGNRWIFPELLDENLPPWNGVGHVYLMGANEPSHAVDVTESLDTGIESLRAHRSYLDGLGRDFDP